MSSTFADIEVGDEVGVMQPCLGPSIRKVTSTVRSRVAASFCRVGFKCYSLTTGKELFGTDGTYIVPLTSEIRAAAKEAEKEDRRWYFARDLSYAVRDLPLEALEKVDAIVKAASPTPPDEENLPTPPSEYGDQPNDPDAGVYEREPEAGEGVDGSDKLDEEEPK